MKRETRLQWIGGTRHRMFKSMNDDFWTSACHLVWRSDTLMSRGKRGQVTCLGCIAKGDAKDGR